MFVLSQQPIVLALGDCLYQGLLYSCADLSRAFDSTPISAKQLVNDALLHSWQLIDAVQQWADQTPQTTFTFGEIVVLVFPGLVVMRIVVEAVLPSNQFVYLSIPALYAWMAV